MAQALASNQLIDQLRRIVGADYVLDDDASLDLMSHDVLKPGTRVAVVVQPDNTQQLSELVRAAAAAGYAVVPRGGGMSYTGGYLATAPHTVLVDLRRMNRVLEINTDDMYVRVECGCTWKALHDALEDTGYRTPYWGTLSGITATVGGGLSQNSIFWGSGQFGTCVDSVVGLEVVLADGEVVKTGAGAVPGGSPFFRHYGPDLTGLFTCDNGALGLKASATFRLIPQLKARRYLSFDFESYDRLLPAMSEISRQGLAMECFAFDPCLQAQRMRRESLAKDVKSLAGVMKASGSVTGAIKSGLKVAMAGRGFMDDARYSLHLIVEERVEAAADACAEQIVAICSEAGGKQLDDSIPRILRANPFTPLNNVVGADGERWAPIHALVPHSRAPSVTAQLEDLVQREAETIERHKIQVGYLFATVSTNCFVLEPVFFWPDALEALHRETVEPAAQRRFAGFEDNPEAREAVLGLRQAMVDLFARNSAVHLQVGKTYPLNQIESRSWQALEDIKAALDPDLRINPGSLGLGLSND
ncbi:MAG: FAD-binding oxidoreductase [Pseudomonadota bacterium]